MNRDTRTGDPYPTWPFEVLTIEHAPPAPPIQVWTRHQALWAAELLDRAPTRPILELHAGAGQVGLLASCLTARDLIACDPDPQCRALIERNAYRNHLHARTTICTHPDDAQASHAAPYGLVLATPPLTPTTAIGPRAPEPNTAEPAAEASVPLPKPPRPSHQTPLAGSHPVVEEALRAALLCTSAVLGRMLPGSSLILRLDNDLIADALAHQVRQIGWTAGGRRSGHGTVLLRLRHP